MASSKDPLYLSLLGLADYFQNSRPASIKRCIQCLVDIFKIKPSQEIEARTHLQLANILLTYTKNKRIARSHSEHVWSFFRMISGFDHVTFGAASDLAALCVQQKQPSFSKKMLRKAIELSNHNVYWHCRLLFQLAEMLVNEKENTVACKLFSIGHNYARLSTAYYTSTLFLLSKAMLLLIDKKVLEVEQVLTQAGQLIDVLSRCINRKEYFRANQLFLQVGLFLMTGKGKRAKPCLKELQRSIQTIREMEDPNSQTTGASFLWLSKEDFHIIASIVTVVHSMQSGNLDESMKYAGKALMEIEKFKSTLNKPKLSIYKIILEENSIMCRLVRGQKTRDLRNISQAVAICKQNQSLAQSHGSQLHTLLGLYGMSMNLMESAEAQFLACTMSSRNVALCTFANLNLAIVYLREKRENEFNAILERINPKTLQRHSQSYSLRAAAFYVLALQAFYQGRYNYAVRNLRETLKIANAEDLNRLISCSHVLLANIFLSLGNQRKSMKIVTKAIQMAGKIQDAYVQMWALDIFKELHSIDNDLVDKNKAYQKYLSLTNLSQNDYFQASQMPEHSLLEWTTGPLPEVGEQNVASSTEDVKRNTN